MRSSGNWAMYFVSLQGHGDVLLAGLERRADGVQAGDEGRVAAHRVEDLGAHPGHDPHRDTTYAESVISTPNIGDSASSGPMQNGMTYMVRPRMQPRYRSVITDFISSGSIQLFVAPASASSPEQM